MAKIEAGKLTLERTPFRLAEPLENGLAVVAPAAAQRGLKLRPTAGPDLPAVLSGDSQRQSGAAGGTADP